MNKYTRHNPNSNLQYPQPSSQIAKSPIRRTNMIHVFNPAKSPMRSRTPVRGISPISIKHTIPASIKYISNLSPYQEQEKQRDSCNEISNGKSIKYINILTDKNYQSNKKQRDQEFNKKSERNHHDSNKLFGKLVNKINSQKKQGGKSNQNGQKISNFTEQVQQTQFYRMQNSKNQYYAQNKQQNQKDSRAFQYELNNNFATNKTKKKSEQQKYEKQQKPQQVNYVGYRIKSIPMKQNELSNRSVSPLQRQKRTNNQKITVITCQKHEKDDNKKQDTTRKFHNIKVDNEPDFSDTNILLKKIEECSQYKPSRNLQDLVKMSFKVQQSLSMDPFI